MISPAQLLGLGLSLIVPLSYACTGCEIDPNSNTDIILTRNVRRMQPDAVEAITGPDRPLEWGSINFLHTTDTHGWLAGHVKQENYGADWGDWLGFVTKMRDKADAMGVDLVVVDTGDLHDGNGLTDVTHPNGWLAMKEIWQKMGPSSASSPALGGNTTTSAAVTRQGEEPNGAGYDILTIGNHELYIADITYYHFENFTKVFGDRYLTSNVQIKHPKTLEWVDIGQKYRYFETKHGVRIMSFGVIFDFMKSSSSSKVTPAAEMIKEEWFQKAITPDPDRPIDLFLVIGHNPVSPNEYSCTMNLITQAIREKQVDTPVQIFGGHNHIRDFAVYDSRATGLGSGKYCETIGWVAMDGVNRTMGDDNGVVVSPRDFGYKSPVKPAVPVDLANTWYYKQYDRDAGEDPVYARRYLDWNRRTLDYHSQFPQRKEGAVTSIVADDVDIEADDKGAKLSSSIFRLRQKLNLTDLYACAPQTYCQYCVPFMAEGSIFTLVTDALSKIVYNVDRKEVPRYIYLNTGAIRYDLAKGPFTLDDSYIVSPFRNEFVYIPDVPFQIADQLLGLMNDGPYQKRDFGEKKKSVGGGRRRHERDPCEDPPFLHSLTGLTDAPLSSLRSRSLLGRAIPEAPKPPSIFRVQNTSPDYEYYSYHYDFETDDNVENPLTPGLSTVDDFGSDGDDTRHSVLPFHDIPIDVMANASFPIDGSNPENVDLVFATFLQPYLLEALARAQRNVGRGQGNANGYTDADVHVYNASLNSNTYLSMYVQQEEAWQKEMPDCPREEYK